MNCHEARQYLELYSLDPAAITGAEAHAARLHLSECEACRLAVDAQRCFDAEVARAMSDIPLPGGLTERLQAVVSAAAVQPARDHGPSRTEYRWLRRWIVTAGVSLVLLLAGTWLLPRGVALTEADLASLVDADLNSLKTAASGTTIMLPSGWRSLRELQLSETPLIAYKGSLAVPLVQLEFRPDRRSPPVAGLLIALPESCWRPRPEATSLASAENHYPAFGTWVVWREGNTVFVCLLRSSNARSLDQLRRLVANNRQVT